MGIPLPPGVKSEVEVDGQGCSFAEANNSPRVNADEVGFILQSTLLPEHHQDPNILAWINKYLICRDARQAAKEVGLTPSSGEHLKRRPDIYRAITAITEKALIKYGYDAAEVVEKVKEIAFIDPIEFEREDGTFKESLREIAPEARRAIKKFVAKNIYEKDPNGMGIVVGKLMTVEFYDKQASLKALGGEKDVFVEKKKIEHTVSGSMKDILLASTKRADDHKAAMLEGGAPIIDVTPKKESDDGGT